jgi:hypothetical protein
MEDEYNRLDDEQLEALDSQYEMEDIAFEKDKQLETCANELAVESEADAEQSEYGTAAEDDSELLSIYEELLGKKFTKIKDNSPEAQKRREYSKERTLKSKKRKRRVIQEAFRQEDIDLQAIIDTEHCTLLIQALTQGLTDTIEKYSKYINRRCEFVLSKFIPSKLVQVAKLYPKSVKTSPGFLYTVQPDTPIETPYTFWVKPNIPLYFEQGSERDIISGYNPEIREAVDCAVRAYNDVVAARNNLEVKYSSIIVSRNIISYADLLKYKPTWFEIVYTKVTGKQLVLENT